MTLASEAAATRRGAKKLARRDGQIRGQDREGHRKDNYVQRVMENLQVYRRRFGGDVLLTDADLRRDAAAR